MRVLALIAARAGSKRIPGKNVRRLGSSPLIVWSVAVGKNIPDICDILVTTDDPAAAKIASDAGALVPWARPAELATDTASSVDACLHALDWYERERGSVDGVLLLQPTSPFRTRAAVLRGLELFAANSLRAVVGVSAAESHPMWCFRIEDNALKPFISGAGLHVRSQDLPPAYVVNGAFYAITPQDLRQRHSFFTEDMVPLTMYEPGESIDIDSEWHWRMAEFILKANGYAPYGSSCSGEQTG